MAIKVELEFNSETPQVDGNRYLCVVVGGWQPVLKEMSYLGGVWLQVGGTVYPHQNDVRAWALIKDEDAMHVMRATIDMQRNTRQGLVGRLPVYVINQVGKALHQPTVVRQEIPHHDFKLEVLPAENGRPHTVRISKPDDKDRMEVFFMTGSEFIEHARTWGATISQGS